MLWPIKNNHAPAIPVIQTLMLKIIFLEKELTTALNIYFKNFSKHMFLLFCAGTYVNSLSAYFTDQLLSIRTAHALYSAVNVKGSNAGFVSQLAQVSLK